ncbi:hypothetical protein QR680_017953 [Steinernema hermaphroditum]|uniref:Ras-GEF domain-containing protein n=1 Tax=Steinernema hermaphroditum TaxID=289476 RepID=A0AA39HHC5_9BILA|nr:hypothetical protein QR680_017953 [Steinernema hermaphroditum]
MSGAKYWGDEKHADAVYAVYLRKVRYVPPLGYDGLPIYRPIDPDTHHLMQSKDTDHLQWETIKEKVIKSGTLERLVECLIGNDDKMDSRHFQVFFTTYRAYASPADVLDLLLKRYEQLDDEDVGSRSAITIQNSIRTVVVCWMDTFEKDFHEIDSDESTILNRLIDFSRRHNLVDIKSRAEKLRHRFRRINEQGGLAAQLPSMSQYTFALGYNSNDYLYSQERAKMFDVGRENCVQIAEQLTFWDAALFKELLPYQCQGSIWSRRHKSHPDTVYTVRATIDQFNAVSQRVMTSIVLPECRSDFRAKIIAKWIDIARELRALKNFSSLKAVLSSLQSEPVYRLRSAWALVSRQSMAQFRELSAIFDVDENGDDHKARCILDAEGTAKSSPLKRPQLIQNCRRTKSDVNLAESQGTVPYLGTFLTDLTMIDQAYSDYVEDGLINFEKRRREFEVMAKIRLFQSAARAYNVPMDRGFCAWFFYLPSLKENDCFERSLQVERPAHSNSNSEQKAYHRAHKSTGGQPTLNHNNNVVKGNTLTRFFSNMTVDDDCPVLAPQNSNDSGFHSHGEDSWASSSNTPNGKLLQSPNITHLQQMARGAFTAPSTPASTVSWRGGCEFNPYTAYSPHKRTASGASSGVPASDSLSRSSSNTNDFAQNSRSGTPNMTEVLSPMGRMNGHQSNGSHVSNCSNGSTSSQSSCGSSGISPSAPANFYLARVGLDDELQTDASTGANYKCIKVENGDRMSALIERVLEKHLIDDADHRSYCLVQLLPDGCEFQLPDQCNPFYAVAPDPSSPMLNFILRKRRPLGLADLPPKAPTHVVAPSAKKLNRMKRSNLLRWSSGYL